MDKPLKQRLVGAAILIALAVIFVPMWVGSPETPEERRATIDLPEPPTDGREVRRIPLADPPRQDEVADDSPERAPEPGARDLPEPDEVPEPDPVPADTEPFDSEPPEIEPVPADEPEPETQAPAPEPEPEPVSEPDPESEPPEAADNQASSGTAGDWVVQVASFGSNESAGNLQNRLEALGFDGIIDTAVRGDSRLHRVRAGPFQQRAQAEQARAKISDDIAGVEPVVMNIRGADAPSGGDAPAAASAYSVQVGVFAREQNANDLRARLTDQGFTCFIDSQTNGERTTWRVRVGPVVARDQAEQLRERLEREAGVEGVVVSHP